MVCAFSSSGDGSTGGTSGGSTGGPGGGFVGGGGGGGFLIPPPIVAVVPEPASWALLVAGDITAAVLRRAGLLSGGSRAVDEILDTAMAGPRPAILDEF